MAYDESLIDQPNSYKLEYLRTEPEHSEIEFDLPEWVDLVYLFQENKDTLVALGL